MAKAPDAPVMTASKTHAATLVFVLFVLSATVMVVLSYYSDADRWGRILVIFSSIEGPGFAAAGVLLGVKVNARTASELSQSRAENATLNERMGDVEAGATEVAESTRANVWAAISILSAEGRPVKGNRTTGTESEMVAHGLDQDGAIELLNRALAKADAYSERLQSRR